MNYYTVLGGGGVIANELARILVNEKRAVKLVSRSGNEVSGTVPIRADATVLEHMVDVVKDSSVVFLCIGLKYDHKVWAEQWPVIISNTIEACKRAGAKLVFLDNVYSYGKVVGPMTETTPYNPCSKKGEIRARIADGLMKEVSEGNLRALIARAADFYGPFADKTGVPNMLVFKPLSQGKKANWLVNDGVRHSYTFTLDIAKALFALSESSDAYNQIWHLPTASNPLTGKEIILTVAKGYGVEPRYRVLSSWMVKLAGLRDKTIAESYEMLYQSEFDYIFDSSKFLNTFRVSPTSYEAGIRETVKYYKTI